MPIYGVFNSRKNFGFVMIKPLAFCPIKSYRSHGSQRLAGGEGNGPPCLRWTVGDVGKLRVSTAQKQQFLMGKFSVERGGSTSMSIE